MDRAEDRIALIEVIERDGRVTRTVDVHRWPVAIGRALDNLVVLDDPHVAARHLVLAPDAQGVLQLRVGDTANGVQLGRRQLGAGQVLPLAEGQLLQVGHTRLRLRLRNDAVPAERALRGSTAAGRMGGLTTMAMVVLAALLLGLVMAEQWVAMDPGSKFTDWLPLATGMPVALVLWCGAWATASKLFQHKFDFWGHLGIALPWLLVMQLMDLLLPQLAAALDWPTLWHATRPLAAVLTALLVRAHLVHVLPNHARGVTAAVAALAVVSLGTTLAFNQRGADRLLSSAPYMSTLPLPGARLGPVVPPDTLVQDMTPLRDELRERVRRAAADEAEDTELGD
jgi:hypothetical protein